MLGTTPSARPLPTSAPTSPTAPPLAQPPAPAESKAAAGGVLEGFVGLEDSPEAFEIGVLDAAGKPVTTLPAGRYTLRVRDYASIHDFVLTGAGVSVRTSVSGRGEELFEITLAPGTYSYLCTPHPESMSGTLQVT